MKKVVVIGGFTEVIEALSETKTEILGYVDFEKRDSIIKYLGTDDNYIESGTKEIPIVLSPDLPEIRRRLYFLYQNSGFNFFSFVHYLSYLSPSAVLHDCVFIQRFAHVSSGVVLEKGVRLNVQSNIMHDTYVGEFSTLAPNAVLLGNVRVGKRCYIGANAVVLPGIIIGDDVIVGAGSVVTKNIESGKIVKGNPAKSE